MIEAENLEKYYGGKCVLRIPEIRITSGEKVGLVGNNGAGKTTFISLILDLIRAESGELRLFDMPVHETEDWKMRVSSYLDENFLIDYLSPEEYFDFVAKVRDISSQQVSEKLREYEKLFRGEILDQNKYIRNLSKGNRKKVGLVGALMPDADLYILDEPFANLDPTAQIQIKNILDNFDETKTMFISSHDLNQLIDICDRIIVLDKGELIKDTPKSEATLEDLEKFFTSNI